MSKELYSNMRGAKVIQVIACEVNEGEGITGDPIHRVTYLYHLDGTFISCDDSVKRNFSDSEYQSTHQSKEV